MYQQSISVGFTICTSEKRARTATSSETHGRICPRTRCSRAEGATGPASSVGQLARSSGPVARLPADTATRRERRLNAPNLRNAANWSHAWAGRTSRGQVALGDDDKAVVASYSVPRRAPRQAGPDKRYTLASQMAYEREVSTQVGAVSATLRTTGRPVHHAGIVAQYSGSAGSTVRCPSLQPWEHLSFVRRAECGLGAIVEATVYAPLAELPLSRLPLWTICLISFWLSAAPSVRPKSSFESHMSGVAVAARTTIQLFVRA